MTNKKFPSRFFILAALLLAACLGGCKATASTDTQATTPLVEQAQTASPVLREFARRREVATGNVKLITESASVVATLHAANPTALVNVPYGLQSSFAEELLNRAGGLANALPPEERPKLMTGNDVLLLSARSWQDDEAKVRQMLRDFNKLGGKTVLFASKAGMPGDIKVDWLIDNGANAGTRDEGMMNSVANVLNAWIWCAEYAAGMTRHGKYPGVLYSMIMPGATEHNKALQRNGEARRTQGEASEKIPAGKLAAAYLAEVRRVEGELAGKTTRGAIDKAGDLIAAQLASGGRVGAATCEHFLMNEITLPHRVPIRGFHVVWRAKNAFAENLKDGDLVLWFGYVGVATVSEDYATPMRKTGAKMITSFVTDKSKPENNAPDALVHIEQHWAPPDSVLKVPFPPGVMAPVSGIDQGLIFLLIEDATATKLAAMKPAAK